ncbi:hypothetical protein JTE90_018715 [Oedothorax gibbosus]|uniref:Cytochrome P450 n=1 Tax=Oedothorax gibbosus TaxID=931172 RepID=A0AAV6TY28_9ARAC|nr:hypothetical protein JTE90_018715 [Oedothorax gibbosus]
MFGIEILEQWNTTWIIGIITVLLLYWYITKDNGHWKNQGVPYVKPLPLIGSIADVFKKPIHEIDLERRFKYGLVYGHFEGLKPFLSVGDPELLRDIFVKDFAVFSSRRVVELGSEIFDKTLNLMKGDDEWKRIRNIITPTFSTGKIKQMLDIFRSCSMTLIKNFRTEALQGKPIDVKRLFGTYSMDVIASSAFSTKLDSHNDPNNEFVSTARLLTVQSVNWRIMLLLCFPSFAKFLKIEAFPSYALEYFKKVTLQIMEERKRTGQVRKDFLQLLMDSAKEVADDQKEDEKGDIASNYEVHEEDQSQLFKAVHSKNLSMDELVAQCVIFFLAGHETVSITLTLATYLLAINPKEQQTLREEVDRVFKESKGDISVEVIQSMTYLENVVSESLRMYPPAVRLDRTANVDYKMRKTGITVKKGNCVTIPVYAIHHDPTIYNDPQIFNPDRFSPEEKAKRPPYSYIPFGAGPRNCVAMRFALMQVKVCLAHVIANFIIKRCPETKVPLEFGKGQGFLIANGAIISMEPRKDSPLGNGNC